MDGVAADGVIGNNAVDEQLLLAAINDVARTMTSLKMGIAKTTTAEANDSIKFLTKDPFLKDLFDVHSGMKLRSVDDLMKEYPYLPLFAIFSLLLADTMEGSVTTIMEIIQSQQKQQKGISQAIIEETSYMQDKRGELAASDAEDAWMSRVGIDVTGANRKEDSENQWWKLIIGIGVIIVVAAVSIGSAVFTGGASIAVGAAVVGALIAIGSIFSLIANVVPNQEAKKALVLVASIFNPIQAIAEGAVDLYCELSGTDPNDEKIRKAKMWTNLAATIVSSLILIGVGIAGSVFTGGATGGAAIALTVANIMNVVSGIVTGATSIVTGALEIRNGQRALERAEMRKVLNQVQASIERMKNILDMIGINIELWTEMFSNDMTIMRGEYDRAARMLKEYNDQKVAIARNIRA